MDTAGNSGSGGSPRDGDRIKREFEEEFREGGPGRHPSIEPNAMYEAIGEMDVVRMHGDVRRSDDGRFNGRIGWRWFFKPLGFALGTGIPGLLLFAGSFWTGEILEIAGLSLVDADGNDWTGLLRLVLIILGLVLIAAAAPAYRPVEWTQESEDRLEEERQYYHRKKFGRWQ